MIPDQIDVAAAAGAISHPVVLSLLSPNFFSYQKNFGPGVAPDLHIPFELRLTKLARPDGH